MTHFSQLRNRVNCLAAILASLALVSCGGDSGTTPDPDEGGGGTTSLTISLAVSSAKPGEQVDINGIPANVDLSSSYAIVVEPGGVTPSPARNESAAAAAAAIDTASTTLLGRRGDGTPYFVAPLRPAEFINGGPVELLIGGGSLTSNVVPFDIDALPPATVTVQEMVAEMQSLLTTWLRVHNTTREELRTMDLQAMPAFLYPLWHAHEILDSPDNPNSLRKLVDGPIPIFDNEVIDFDVTNRLISGVGVVGFLGDEVVSIDSLTTLDTLQLAPPNLSRVDAGAGASAFACNIPAGNYGINTASRLDIAMSNARAAASHLEGITGDLLNDWGDAASVAGKIPQLKGGATVVGAGLYIFKLVNEAASKLLPTSFDYGATNFQIADNDVEYNEDDTGGFWLKFMITGVSQGWVLDQDALGAILKVAKFSDLGGLNTEGLGTFATQLQNYVITEGTKFVADELTGGNLLEVCPGRWTVDASSSVFSESEIAFGTSFEMNGHTFFETKEPGTSTLKVKTKDGLFGNAPPTDAKQDIRVVAIDVQIVPSDVTMEDSEVQSFDAIVTHASDDKVEWFVPAPLQEVERLNFGKTIVIQAPPPPPQGASWTSAILKARSQAMTGSREGKVNSDPRDGLASINHKDSVVIYVQPRYMCVREGEAADSAFVATVVGVSDYNVIWERVSGYGSIDQNGLYRAPSSGTTDDVISARVEGYPDAIAFANVHVGACNCSYKVSGVYSPALEGGQVAYLFSDLPEGFHNYQFFYMLQEQVGIPEGVGFSMNLGPYKDDPAPRPGQTGTYKVGVSFFDGSSSWTTQDTTITVDLTILEHTDTYMLATFAGFLAQGSPPNQITRPVSGSVRAGRWDGGRWPCE